MGTKERKIPKLKPKLSKLVLLIVVVGIIAGITIAVPATRQGKQPPEVITVSTLQEIINVSELSTYTAVYNGIAQVMNEEQPDETDYYVSYEAKVYAGIDFEAVNISVDNNEKVIRIEIPDVTITRVDVDVASMDFIFYNNKANTSTVSQAAYKACEADAQQESETQKAIYDLAKQNARNVLTALIQPIVEQADAEFTLSVS